MKNTCTIEGCGRTVVGRGWCILHWSRWKRTGSPEGAQKLSLEDRFWAKVDKAGPVPDHRPELGPCWVWTASKGKQGYGKFGMFNRGWRTASRVSWEIAHGAILDGLWVLHHCDNPSCVNPAHLFLGSPTVNARDMIAKERNVRHGRPSRFTLAEKQLIAERYESGTKQGVLAEELGVTDGRISQIVAEVRKGRS